jgi:hypothetical protein
MNDIAVLAGASAAYIQELQFVAAETVAYQAAILQVETIQAAYVLASAADDAATQAAYAHAAEAHAADARAESATAHTASVDAATARAANVRATANQSAEALASSEIRHHHFHPGGPGPADELAALTQQEAEAPPGTRGLDTSA